MPYSKIIYGHWFEFVHCILADDFPQSDVQYKKHYTINKNTIKYKHFSKNRGINYVKDGKNYTNLDIKCHLCDLVYRLL